VDIQPIAIQISKLRFFISLVVDQKTNNNPVDNFGIRPLPNLEAKFVAANTLIGLHNQTNLSMTDDIQKSLKEMKIAKHKIFGARTVKTKRKYREKVSELRLGMVNKLNELGFVCKEDHLMLLDWDMFDLNKAALFFDSEWMFGISEGFDIVIGNPPYGVSIKEDYRKEVVRCLGNVPDYEIYYYFIQAGRNLLLNNGTICYIIPNTWLFNTYARKFRESVLEKWNIIEILDCTKFKIFDATVLNSIITWQKSQLAHERKTLGYRKTAKKNSFAELIKVPRMQMYKSDLRLMNQNWGLAFSLDNKVVGIVTRMSLSIINIETVFPEISQGLIAYDKYQGQSDDIIRSRAYHSFEYRKGLKKWLWGEDVKRYILSWNGQEYIDYCSGIANPRQPKYFIGKRLLVREITNPSVFATITDDELYNDPVIIIVKDNDLYPLEVVLAILNSKLATFYHFNHSPKATKGAFPKILVQDIKDFPLPTVSDKQRNLIVNLVDKILAAKKDDQQADTREWEEEIDKKVYHLYDLTYEEVLIVDPETPITKEEYENTK
jgi:hypothetical protein